MSLLLRPVIDVKMAYGYGTVLPAKTVAAGDVAVTPVALAFVVVPAKTVATIDVAVTHVAVEFVVPPAKTAAFSIVAVILVALAPVVILGKPAAVAIVAVMRVVPVPVVIPGKPAAVQYVALVVVAVLPEHAVASPGMSAVMIGPAMILIRKNVVEMEPAPCAILIKPAVTAGIVWRAKNAVTT